ncbi:MAG TPA: hypothetical protein VH300_04480 [Thermoleophilaceae bacterium]|nr:hypothetical protein [Thermoleophilaceae bacterium]
MKHVGAVKQMTVTTVAALAISAVAFAAGPSIHVTPGTVHAAHRVQLSGNAGGCPTGDRVMLLSRAFSPRHEFAGVPAVFARVRSNAHYGHSVLIPATTHAGHYSISGRCGGGNFGVTAHLRVLSP